MATPLTSRSDRVRQSFVDVICADAELLRAEFEAIIAASWSGTLPPKRGDVPDPGINGPVVRYPLALRRDRPAAGPDAPGAGSSSRQRSPPSRCL
ncbi:MAG TPA: hypothetical protein VJ851_06890 [Jatrophihabitans sp.]|nr:hypothetical protein [Jatrophihabitans sp.]